MADISEQLIGDARTAGADIFARMNAAAWTREHIMPEQADRLVAPTLDGIPLRSP